MLPSTGILDDFNRTNSTGMSNAAWSSDYDALGRASHDIVSNTANAPASGFGSNWWNGKMFGPNCEVYTTIAAMPTNQAMRIHLRLNGQGTANTTGYELECEDTGVGFLKRIDGSNFTTVSVLHDFNTNVIWQVGDTMLLRAIGSQISAHRQRSGVWTTLGFAEDTTYSGAGHIHIMSQNDTDAGFDNFGGGNVFVPRYAATVISYNPVVYYRMDELSAPLQDSSGNGIHTTTVSGTPVYGKPGKVGDTGIEFDSASTEYFTAPHHAALNVDDVGSVIAWIKRGDFSTTEQTIIAKSTSFFLGISNQKVFLAKGSITGISSGATDVPNDGKYHFVGATKNGSAVEIYLDGVDDGGGTTAVVWDSNTDIYSLYVGAEQGPGSPFNGVLDEIAVFDYALTPEQMLTLYQAGQQQSYYAYRTRVGR